jgi:tetratricopeptide (TPR) repeat protein
MQEHLFLPHHEERRLIEELRGEKDPKRRQEIKKELIHLYIYFGEHFKMTNQPDPQQAKKYLQKVLKLQEDHPVAHYRLAHLYLKEKEYTKAAYHFDRALTGSREEELNETQKMLTHMFLVNCGIFIASNALEQIEHMEEAPYDEEKIERYRNHIFLWRKEGLDRALYRIITPEIDEPVPEEQYFLRQEQLEPHEVMLCISEREEIFVKFQSKKKTLDIQSFYLLCMLLRSEQALTVEEIKTKLFDKFLEKEVTDAAIRKMFERLRERLPFWDDIIETVSIGNKVARKRKEGISYCIFCRASDVFPGE